MHRWIGVLCLAATLAVATTALAGPKKFRGNPDDGFAELDKKFTLRFYDAVTGKPISGATVHFEGKEGRTNGEGAVRFTFPDDLRPGEEKRYGRFERSGYVNAKVPILFQVGTIFFNRFSVSPMIPIGYVRVVLDWGKAPKDLDAHLEKAGDYHISFRKTKNYKELAWLDRDDMNGFGPETITVKKIDSRGTYRFFIHNWTDKSKKGSSSLSDSKAHVRVYTRKGLKQSFSVPGNSSGTYWHVFDVRKGQIVPVDRVVQAMSGIASEGGGGARTGARTGDRRSDRRNRNRQDDRTSRTSRPRN